MTKLTRVVVVVKHTMKLGHFSFGFQFIDTYYFSLIIFYLILSNVFALNVDLRLISIPMIEMKRNEMLIFKYHVKCEPMNLELIIVSHERLDLFCLPFER